jgi:hypothetical protein
LGDWLFYVRLGLEVECLTLFAALTCVESLMMTVSSVVGQNFLAVIVIGAGIQVRDVISHDQITDALIKHAETIFFL